MEVRRPRHRRDRLARQGGTALRRPDYVLEEAIVCDFALVRAWKGDRHGNLVFNKSARNFNPLAAMAGRITIAEVEDLVEPGDLDPDQIHTPACSCTACSRSPRSRPPTSGSRSGRSATPAPGPASRWRWTREQMAARAAS